MDFSSKQALAVVVVIAVAALVIGASVILTKANNGNAAKTSKTTWSAANGIVTDNAKADATGDGTGAGTGGALD